jgi:hypothetical protein
VEYRFRKVWVVSGVKELKVAASWSIVSRGAMGVLCTYIGVYFALCVMAAFHAAAHIAVSERQSGSVQLCPVCASNAAAMPGYGASFPSMFVSFLGGAGGGGGLLPAGGSFGCFCGTSFLLFIREA